MIPIPEEIVERFSKWARESRPVEAALLFGSRARNQSSCSRSDAYSDIDFQIITHRPSVFSQKSWANGIIGMRSVASVNRDASGGVSKATVLFETGTELDVVVIPAFRMHMARIAMALGLHKHFNSLARSLDELSTVLSGGYRIIKGEKKWGWFYSTVVREIRGARMSDADIIKTAEEFVCDCYWVDQKTRRGEFVAAQRMLHRSLLEINFRLAHELRLRRGLPSFREARRIEFLLGQRDLEMLLVESSLTRASLQGAAQKCSGVLQKLMQELVSDQWHWPPEVILRDIRTTYYETSRRAQDRSHRHSRL